MRHALVLLVLLVGTPAWAQTYRVYPVPVESPLHASPPPPADARALVADPSDAVASPWGWHDTDGAPGPEHITTQGNNVLGYADANGNNLPDPGESPDGGPALAFDFPLDLTRPADFPAARTTNLFYWANVFHDVLWMYGFDEAAGNFQANNYGRGGLGGDAVRANTGSGGAAMSTPPDGQVPRLVVGSFLAARPGALDNGVVVHELAHGLTNRRTGGPANVSCLQNAEQGGEGWSDWYALMFTMRPEHTTTTPRTVGTYFGGGEPGGPGLRPAPYTTAFTQNDYTYQRTRSGPGGIVPHGIGFVWATILWEVTWELIGAYGFSPDLYDADGTAGNQIALSLVTEALALQPCGPGFVDARNAILVADQTLYGGTHLPLLWAAFARRGLGYSASQGSPNQNADNTEAFDLFPVGAEAPSAPALTATLNGPVPNPTAGAARVAFALPRAGPVRLALYDLTGRAVAVLAEGVFAAGRHEAGLDARGLAAGVYVLRLEAAGASRTRRLVVSR